LAETPSPLEELLKDVADTLELQDSFIQGKVPIPSPPPPPPSLEESMEDSK